METFRLDRSAFKAGNHETASNNYDYWKSRSLEERLQAANYLNSVAFNYPVHSSPRLDRNTFSVRKRDH
jgi:hypothetical protein